MNESGGTSAGIGGHQTPALYTETIPTGPEPGRGTRIVLVHGFTQTGRSWTTVGNRLAQAGHQVILPDAPGHGGSTAIRADLPAGATLLGEAGGQATYVGYSMGARLCLHLALARPDLVQALVLLGATAGIEDPTERFARRAADEAFAAILDPGGPEDPVAAAQRLEEFLQRWLAGPMWATLSPTVANLDDRRRNTAAGLASSLRLTGTGTQEPLWDRLHTLAMPTLVMAGQLDTTFTARANRIAAAIGPNATLAFLPGAGHAAHLESADAFTAALCTFVGDVEGGREQDSPKE